MAPNSTKKFNELQNQIFKINQLTLIVDSLDSLLNAKQLYFEWLFAMQDLVKEKKIDRRAMSLWRDAVQDCAFAGGVGSWFGDTRSVKLLGALQKESKNNLILVGTLSHLFNSKILKKEGEVFYFKGNTITLNPDTNPFCLLNILFTYGDNEGYLSYPNIHIHLRKQLPKDISVSQDTITNARDNLFRHARVKKERLENTTPSGRKLIETRHGEGLILNNEDWN